jgi:hypothetical protein
VTRRTVTVRLVESDRPDREQRLLQLLAKAMERYLKAGEEPPVDYSRNSDLYTDVPTDNSENGA